jgi:hypothetical protein
LQNAINIDEKARALENWHQWFLIKFQSLEELAARVPKFDQKNAEDALFFMPANDEVPARAPQIYPESQTNQVFTLNEPYSFSMGGLALANSNEAIENNFSSTNPVNPYFQDKTAFQEEIPTERYIDHSSGDSQDQQSQHVTEKSINPLGQNLSQSPSTSRKGSKQKKSAPSTANAV